MHFPSIVSQEGAVDGSSPGAHNGDAPRADSAADAALEVEKSKRPLDAVYPLLSSPPKPPRSRSRSDVCVISRRTQLAVFAHSSAGTRVQINLEGRPVEGLMFASSDAAVAADAISGGDALNDDGPIWVYERTPRAVIPGYGNKVTVLADVEPSPGAEGPGAEAASRAAGAAGPSAVEMEASAVPFPLPGTTAAAADAATAATDATATTTAAAAASGAVARGAGGQPVEPPPEGTECRDPPAAFVSAGAAAAAGGGGEGAAAAAAAAQAAALQPGLAAATARMAALAAGSAPRGEASSASAQAPTGAEVGLPDAGTGNAMPTATEAAAMTYALLSEQRIHAANSKFAAFEKKHGLKSTTINHHSQWRASSTIPLEAHAECVALAAALHAETAAVKQLFKNDQARLTSGRLGETMKTAAVYAYKARMAGW